MRQTNEERKNKNGRYLQNETIPSHDSSGCDGSGADQLWKNSDYAGRKTGAAFGDAAIYLCGQYGPDFYAVSYTGETLARIEQFDPGYYWASEIELQDGYAAVYLHGGTSNYDDPKIFYVDLRTYAVRSELDERAAEPLPLDQLKLLLDTYFADYPWGNEDIVSGSAVNGCWKNDTEALFEIRVQTKSAEWTHQANILVGTVSIDAERLTGYIEWTGGNKEDIDLQTGQSAANDNSYMEQYKAVLLVHPTMSSGYTTEYTLYDIDKNGIPELIVREKAVWYYIYIFIHLTAQRLSQAKKITGVTVTACMRMMATASLFTTEAWDICTLNTFPCFP